MVVQVHNLFANGIHDQCLLHQTRLSLLLVVTSPFLLGNCCRAKTGDISIDGFVKLEGRFECLPDINIVGCLTFLSTSGHANTKPYFPGPRNSLSKEIYVSVGC